MRAREFVASAATEWSSSSMILVWSTGGHALRHLHSTVRLQSDSRADSRTLLRIQAGGQASERACAKTSRLLGHSVNRARAVRRQCDANPLRHRPLRSANSIFVERARHVMADVRQHVIHLLSGDNAVEIERLISH